SLLHLAIDSGADAAIVSGPVNLSAELSQFLETHASADFPRLDSLFRQVSCLLVSEGAIQTTEKQVFVIPLAAAHQDIASQTELLDKILSPLVKAMHAHKVAEFCQSLGAEQVALSGLRGGMLVAKLRYLNKVLQLKPNVMGIGVNLNEVIEQALGPPQRV